MIFVVLCSLLVGSCATILPVGVFLPVLGLSLAAGLAVSVVHGAALLHTLLSALVNCVAVEVGYVGAVVLQALRGPTPTARRYARVFASLRALIAHRPDV